MRVRATLFLLLAFAVFPCALQAREKSFRWPDGTLADEWFSKNVRQPSGRRFNILSYGASRGSSELQTEAIQRTIDAAYAAGGGVVVIPGGEWLSSSLFFKPGTSLFLATGACLKGSDRIEDYPEAPVHIEGVLQPYVAALVNAYGVDGFSISGRGTIDGNGLVYWKAFWDRRAENKNCTNLEVRRPRLIYIAGSRDVSISGVSLKNSGFWTTHLYKCSRVKIQGVNIFAPTSGVKAPSSDGIDLDACEDVRISGCTISVNDDFIALKGGKGPWADTLSDNGPVRRVLVERCSFGEGPHALTFGSECYLAENIIMRDCTVDGTRMLVRLKLRPDTPQIYRNIMVRGVRGTTDSVIHVRAWTQFFDPQGRGDIPVSRIDSLTVSGCNISCRKVKNVKVSPSVGVINDLLILPDNSFTYRLSTSL